MRKYDYIGFFADKNELLTALEGYEHLEKTVSEPHVTLSYRPRSEDVPAQLFGEKVTIEVTGYGKDENCEGIAVNVISDNELLKEKIAGMDMPHITLSLSREGKARDTEKLEYSPIEPFKVSGVFKGYAFGYKGRKILLDRPVEDQKEAEKAETDGIYAAAGTEAAETDTAGNEAAETAGAAGTEAAESETAHNTAFTGSQDPAITDTRDTAAMDAQDTALTDAQDSTESSDAADARAELMAMAALEKQRRAAGKAGKGRQEKSAKSAETGRSAESGKTAKAEKSAKAEKPAESSKAAQTEKSAETGRHAKAAETGREHIYVIPMYVQNALKKGHLPDSRAWEEAGDEKLGSCSPAPYVCTILGNDRVFRAYRLKENVWKHMTGAAYGDRLRLRETAQKAEERSKAADGRVFEIRVNEVCLFCFRTGICLLSMSTSFVPEESRLNAENKARAIKINEALLSMQNVIKGTGGRGTGLSGSLEICAEDGKPTGRCLDKCISDLCSGAAFEKRAGIPSGKDSGIYALHITDGRSGSDADHIKQLAAADLKNGSCRNFYGAELKADFLMLYVLALHEREALTLCSVRAAEEWGRKKSLGRLREEIADLEILFSYDSVSENAAYQNCYGKLEESLKLKERRTELERITGLSDGPAADRKGRSQKGLLLGIGMMTLVSALSDMLLCLQELSGPAWEGGFEGILHGGSCIAMLAAAAAIILFIRNGRD